ncbi:MAG: hypothetical protein H0X64_13555 [Gemmatimonadaceae bacterium]|nr:hypothetical protein [Gemmatimonadaceae bacterium]
MSAPVSTMTSPLTSAIRRFVDHKRVLGRRYDTETGALRLFDRYLVEQHITTCAAITPAVIDTFLRSRPRRRPRSFNHLRGVLARFFTWLVSRDLVPASPVRTPTQRGSGSRIPCILSADRVRVLVEEAARLPDAPGTTDRGATYRAIFVVLYALGLRVGEVCRPHFHVVIAAEASPPRVHDLRHTCAVSTLLRWYRTGVDPAARLLHLSTFLGHVQPESTAVSLTITADLLAEASGRFEQLARPLFTERQR